MIRRHHALRHVVANGFGRLRLTLFGAGLAVSLTVGGGLVSPAVLAAAAPGVPDACQGSFLGLVPWYHYMGNELVGSGPDGHCEVQCFNVLNQGTNSDGTANKNACGQTDSDVPLVLLAIVDDLLHISGLAAVAFIMYGAFRYTASQGSPEQTAQAQSTIINALVGMAVAIVAIAFVSFLGDRLGG